MTGIRNLVEKISGGKDWREMTAEEKKEASQAIEEDTKEHLKKSYETLKEELMTHGKSCGGEVVYAGITFID